VARKRTEREKRVLKALSEWENSKLDIRCARAVIAAADPQNGAEMTDTMYVYLKDGKISLWKKANIWHKWQPKSPFDGKPCFWGNREEEPQEHGYVLIGAIK
jgi:hypothetical protein